MTSTLRLEIVIDSVATNAILSLIEPHPSVTCTVLRTFATKCRDHFVSGDDLSDSLSYNQLILFIPKKLFATIEKELSKLLTKYHAHVFISECDELLSYQPESSTNSK